MVDKNLNVSKDYQDLFLGKNPLGQKVLGMILDDVDFMNIAADPQQQIAQDEIKIILSRCGIGLGMTGQQYIQALAGKKLENFEEEEQ